MNILERKNNMCFLDTTEAPISISVKKDYRLTFHIKAILIQLVPYLIVLQHTPFYIKYKDIHYFKISATYITKYAHNCTTCWQELLCM